MNLMYAPPRTVEIFEVRLIGLPNIGIFGGCSNIIILYMIRTIYSFIK